MYSRRRSRVISAATRAFNPLGIKNALDLLQSYPSIIFGHDMSLFARIWSRGPVGAEQVCKPVRAILVVEAHKVAGLVRKNPIFLLVTPRTA